MNTEDYVSFEVAKLLKEKGFDEKVTSVYIHVYEGDNGWRLRTEYRTDDYNREEWLYISAPSLWQVAKWLRGKGWHVQVMLNGVRTAYFVRVYEIIGNGKVIEVPGQYDDYESALAAGIEAAAKLI